MDEKKKDINYVFILILSTLILLLSIGFSVRLGVAGGNLSELVDLVILGKGDSEIGQIMFEMRFPRALAACIVGAALSMAGGIMQGLMGNPLADAGLLGINAGASFFVTILAAFLPTVSYSIVMLVAFLGASFAMFLVYSIGMEKGKAEVIQLILTGSAVSMMLIGLSQGISLVFGLSKSLSFWTAGSLSGITWRQLFILSPWLIVAMTLSFFLADKLNILEMGEEVSVALGIDLRRIRGYGMLLVLILAGGSVSLVGGISFIGLIVPHTVRLLLGGNYRKVLPLTAILGGILLVLADILARVINAPFDTPVGALVSAIGVPIFMILTYRKDGDLYV